MINPCGLTGRLAAHATRISYHLRRAGFDPAQAAQRQVLALAEEVGEFVGAYRRWSGQARRTGTAQEMGTELADVVITAFVTAEELGVDLDTVIAAKLRTVYTRGWRETTACQHSAGVYCSRCIETDPDFQAHARHRVPVAGCPYCPDPDDPVGDLTGAAVAA